jgi:hypothetical protein
VSDLYRRSLASLFSWYLPSSFLLAPFRFQHFAALPLQSCASEWQRAVAAPPPHALPPLLLPPPPLRQAVAGAATPTTDRWMQRMQLCTAHIRPRNCKPQPTLQRWWWQQPLQAQVQMAAAQRPQIRPSLPQPQTAVSMCVCRAAKAGSCCVVTRVKWRFISNAPISRHCRKGMHISLSSTFHNVSECL